MKELDHIPARGQCIAIWEYDGKLWSSTIVSELGSDFVECYNSHTDGWVTEHKNLYRRLDAKYYMV